MQINSMWYDSSVQMVSNKHFLAIFSINSKYAFHLHVEKEGLGHYPTEKYITIIVKILQEWADL